MASLTVLTSPSASTNSNTFLLTTTSSTIAKIAPKRSSDGARARRNRPTSPPSAARGPSVARRNERERNRVRQVNLGFATLRQHVPNRSKKMSKVETLRSAVQYIRQLQALLGETSSSNDGSDDCYGGADENCGGMVPAFAEAFARSHLAQPHLETLVSTGGGSSHSAASGSTAAASASSPAPSLGSDASSPYDSLSPEDEELIDFTTWLS